NREGSIFSKALESLNGSFSKKTSVISSYQESYGMLCEQLGASTLKNHSVFIETSRSVAGGSLKNDDARHLCLQVRLVLEEYGIGVGINVLETIFLNLEKNSEFQNPHHVFDASKLETLKVNKFFYDVKEDKNSIVEITSTGKKVPLQSLKKLPETLAAKKLKEEIRGLVYTAQGLASSSNSRKKAESISQTSNKSQPLNSKKPSIAGENKRKESVFPNNEKNKRKKLGETVQSQMKQTAQSSEKNMERHRDNERLDAKYFDEQQKKQKQDAAFIKNSDKKNTNI
ncbi:MAG: hypothetical protein V4489_08930, partial [Chlamydiota bacterium]